MSSPSFLISVSNGAYQPMVSLAGAPPLPCKGPTMLQADRFISPIATPCYFRTLSEVTLAIWGWGQLVA